MEGGREREEALFRTGGKTLGKKLQVREQVWARSDTGCTVDASGPSLSAKNSEFSGDAAFPRSSKPCGEGGEGAGESHQVWECKQAS